MDGELGCSYDLIHVDLRAARPGRLHVDALLAPREPRVGERRRREHPGARAQRLPEERREPRLVGGAEQQHVRQDDGRAAPPRDRRRAEQVALDVTNTCGFPSGISFESSNFCRL